MKSSWSRPLAASALASLWMFAIWTSLLTYTPQDEFFMQQPPGRAQYLGAILSTILLALGFWAAMAIIDLLPGGALKRAVQFCFLWTLPIGLNTLREALAISQPLLRGEILKIVPVWALLLAAAILGVLMLLATLRWTGQCYRVVLTTLVFLSPVSAVTIGGGLWRVARGTPAIPEPARAQAMPQAPHRNGPRVVWILFDGLDERIAFEDRPKGLDLPELDSLRRESLFAFDAHSPGDSTLLSVTGLLSGRRVANTVREGPASMKLWFADGGPAVEWQEAESVFSEARRSGYETAAVGWYLPYCRVLGSQLDYCQWLEIPMKYNSYGTGLSEVVPNQLRGLFETSVLSPRGRSLTARHHARNIIALQEYADKAVAAEEYGLVFLHLPAPHPPHVYNRKSGRFDLSNQPVQGYTDSLALADLTLGRLRKAMANAGLWDSTTIVLSSDHYFHEAPQFDGKRSSKVPFLVKLPNQHEQVAYSNPLQTVVTKSLVLSILRGSVATPEQLVAFLSSSAR